MSDEGYILLQSLDMLHGKVLYRDMDAFVTPGIWFLHALLFRLVEPSVAASRALAFVQFLAVVWVAYRITRELAGRSAARASVALLGIFCVWAFPAWTFSFYSPFAIASALGGVERLLAWRRRRRPRDLYWAGLLLGSSIAFKQNYGTFALLGGALGLVPIRIEAGERTSAALRAALPDAARLAAGVAAVALPIAAYLAWHGALAAAFDALIVHPFEFGRRQDIPYLPLSQLWSGKALSRTEQLTYTAHAIYHTQLPFVWLRGLRVAERLHVLLYWTPPLVLLIGAALAWRPGRGRRPDAGLLILVLCAGMVFLGVFPRADFNHLINVFQPLLIVGVVVGQRLAASLPPPRPPLVRVAAWAAGALLLLYTCAAGFWYVHMLLDLSTAPDLARAGVLMREREAALIEHTARQVESRTERGEALLTVPDIAMINFLTDRPMPSRYYNLYDHHIAHDGGEEVVAGAEARGVRVALVRYDDFFSDRRGLREYAPKLAHYLLTRFDVELTIANERYLLLARRDVPRTPPAPSFLHDCRAARGRQQKRKHLLFDTLYQRFPRPRFGRTAETVCRVRVPPRSELVVGFGHRPARFARPESTLTMEIVAQADGQPQTIFSEVLPVAVRPRMSRPPYPERHVDLSGFADQTVSLVFRTALTGAARTAHSDLLGFASVWQNPRIETRPETAAR